MLPLPPRVTRTYTLFPYTTLFRAAPPGEVERQKIVSWFQHEGLGQGAAGNKAATYLLLSSPIPNEAPRATSKAAQSESSGPRPVRRQVSRNTQANNNSGRSSSGRGNGDQNNLPARSGRSEEHTSELQSLMRISYAVFCLKKKNKTTNVSIKQQT